MNKVVYNACFGGFGLSDKAVIWLEQNAREEIKHFLKNVRNRETNNKNRYGTVETSMGYSLIYDFHENGIKRHDSDLVKCVEVLGDKANGECAKLKIYELSGSIYRINEYDGNETVIDNYDDYINVNEL